MSDVSSPVLKVAFLGDKDACIAETRWAQNVIGHIRNHFVEMEPSEAHVLVVSDVTTNDHRKNEALVNQFLAVRRNKPIVVFLHDDPAEPMRLSAPSRVLLLRTSINRSTAKPYEQVLPSFQAEDNKVCMLSPALCLTAAKPFVGFCGVVRWPSRRATCDALLALPELFDTKFVYRYDHHTRQSKEDQERFKREFNEILQQCPYQLCCRGGGNFSHRFYETLAAGRIPVLIDTDTMLPPNVPNGLWDRCIVMANSAEALPEKLLQFHAKHNVSTTQVMCRNLWQTYLSFEGYAKYMEKQITLLLNK